MNTQKLKTQIKVDMKTNNISDLAPKRTDFEKVKKFEKWMRKKLKNVHVGNNERMCRAYEIVIV